VRKREVVNVSPRFLELGFLEPRCQEGRRRMKENE
jgi:hypothetical protein